MTNKEVLAVIPARGGSVRVPMKNIKALNGLPLISYAIKAAQKSEAVTRIVVSTDDDGIKRVAEECGAEVPFKRPAYLATDVPTESVIIHAVNWLAESEGYTPAVVVTLEPPSPFRKPEHIDRCVQEIMADGNIDSALTIHPVSSRPEWMVYLKDDCQIEAYTEYFAGEAVLQFPASQIFPELYQSNGVVFACRRQAMLKYRSLIGKNCVGVVIDRKDSFDLDEPEDFEMCELLMRRDK